MLSPDQVHLEYSLHGSGDPTLLLIHDWACSGSYWHAQVESLARRYTVVVMDLAGHGASGRNRSHWTIEAYAQDVATVAGQLPGSSLVLVGHSMGGVVALAAAPLIGGRLRGIIAVESLQSLGTPPLSHLAVQRQLMPFQENFVGATREWVPSLFPPGADARLVSRVAYDMSLASPQVAIPSREAWLTWNPGAVLSALHVPVRAINSDRQPTDTARIRRYLPDFEAQVLPHTGHFLMMEDPQRFNAALLREVERLRAP